MRHIKLKLLLIVLVFSAFNLKASPVYSLSDSIKKTTHNVAAAGRDTNNITGADRGVNDTSELPLKKRDKRGVFTITAGWQNLYQYMGSYYVEKYNVAYAEVRYKFWFGLFGAVSPQFLFNKDSISYVGSNLTIGFDNEWFRNFHASISYTYCAHEDFSVIELQDLFSNDFDAYVYYANKIITPEIRYDLTFGVVSSITSFSNISAGRINVLGGDNVINVGLSHTFDIVNKRNLNLGIKIGDNANFGTANALLSGREQVPNDNGTGYTYEDITHTGDKFSAINDEANLTVYFTLSFLSINPYLNFSVPFRDLASEQAAFTGQPADIVTKPFFYGGIAVVLKFPPHGR